MSDTGQHIITGNLDSEGGNITISNKIINTPIEKESYSITRLIKYLSDSLEDKHFRITIIQKSEIIRKMDENQLSDEMRDDIKQYGNIKCVVENFFNSFDISPIKNSKEKILNWINDFYKDAIKYKLEDSCEIWLYVKNKVKEYIITHNKNNEIEDWQANGPIDKLLIYAFVQCKLLKNPEERNK